MPTKPTLVLSRLSSTSFRASITSDVGTTNRLYYRKEGTTAHTTGPTRVGSGTIDVTGLEANASYQVYVVSDTSGALSLPEIGSISLSSSDTLSAAIHRKWDSLATLNQNGGKLFTNEVPDVYDGSTLSFPFTCLIIGKTEYTWTFEDEYYESNIVEFRTFAIGAQAAEQAEAAIREAFDWQHLPFLEAKTVKVEPIDARLSNEHTRSKDGKIIFLSSLTYDITVFRTL